MKNKIISILILIIILTCGCIDLSSNNDYSSYLEGIEIGIYKSHNKLYIEDIGINKSLFSKFDNNSLILKINFMNQEYFQDFTYHKGSSWFYTPDKEIHLEVSDLNYRYSLSFHYVINSEYSDVRNSSIIGINNYLNFSCELKGKKEIDIKLNYEFFKYEYMLNKTTSQTLFIFSGNQDNNNEFPTQAHIFYIRPLVIYED